MIFHIGALDHDLMSFGASIKFEHFYFMNWTFIHLLLPCMVSVEYVVGSGFGHDISVIRISHTGQATFDGSDSWAVTLHLLHL